MTDYNPPTIILVAPQMGENIGAAARAMKNFGCHDLRIISPRDGWPNEKAKAMAAGAHDLVANAKIYSSLPEALVGIEYVYATTATKREINKEYVELRQITAHYKNNIKNAIIFGRESSGLTNSEISYANVILNINTSPEFSSLNLGQAVLAACYELFHFRPKNIGVNAQILASHQEVESMLEHLITSLKDKKHFRLPEKEHQMQINIRNIFMRIPNLSKPEVQAMRGIIKSLIAK